MRLSKHDETGGLAAHRCPHLQHQPGLGLNVVHLIDSGHPNKHPVPEACFSL